MPWSSFAIASACLLGFLQEQGIDYDQTFTGVAKGMAYKTVFALAAQYDWEIEQIDVVTAFL